MRRLAIYIQSYWNFLNLKKSIIISLLKPIDDPFVRYCMTPLPAPFSNNLKIDNTESSTRHEDNLVIYAYRLCSALKTMHMKLGQFIICQRFYR